MSILDHTFCTCQKHLIIDCRTVDWSALCCIISCGTGIALNCVSIFVALALSLALALILVLAHILAHILTLILVLILTPILILILVLILTIVLILILAFITLILISIQLAANHPEKSICKTRSLQHSMSLEVYVSSCKLVKPLVCNEHLF